MICATNVKSSITNPSAAASTPPRRKGHGLLSKQFILATGQGIPELPKAILSPGLLSHDKSELCDSLRDWKQNKVAENQVYFTRYGNTVSPELLVAQGDPTRLSVTYVPLGMPGPVANRITRCPTNPWRLLQGYERSMLSDYLS